MKTLTLTLISLSFLLLLTLAAADDGGDDCSSTATKSTSSTLHLKLVAFFSILFGGFLGVCIPILGKWVPFLRPETDFFFIVKAFAAGVILATGFIHILPDAFDDLTSSCLPDHPWGDFPFAGFTAMVAAIGTLMLDSLATGYFMRANGEGSKKAAVVGDLERNSKVEVVEDDEYGAGEGQAHVHTHAAHGHAHGVVAGADASSELIRHRVISQVLELGIVVHSVIIGISLGASSSNKTIRPLVVALTFHQFFEGTGLGGCIIQAKFKLRSMATMILFFSLTTPVGIAIGIGISSVYNENSPTALIVEGILNGAAAGILIYMALVDLLAVDFMNPKVQKKGMLQLGVNVSLLMGAGLMSLLAKWA